jgi:hypothetical protein
MPVIRREFSAPFNRKGSEEDKRFRREMADAGYPAPPPEQPALPPTKNQATRPDLYPAMARGVASANSAAVRPSWDGYYGGTNSQDVNNHPTDKIATSGADRTDTMSPDERKGEATRARKRVL